MCTQGSACHPLGHYLAMLFDQCGDVHLTDDDMPAVKPSGISGTDLAVLMHKSAYLLFYRMVPTETRLGMPALSTGVSNDTPSWPGDYCMRLSHRLSLSLDNLAGHSKSKTYVCIIHKFQKSYTQTLKHLIGHFGAHLGSTNPQSSKTFDFRDT